MTGPPCPHRAFVGAAAGDGSQRQFDGRCGEPKMLDVETDQRGAAQPSAASSNSARLRVRRRSRGSGGHGDQLAGGLGPAGGALLSGGPRARSQSPRDRRWARRNRSGDVFPRLPPHGDLARRRSASSCLGSKRAQPWWHRPPAGPGFARGTSPRMPSNPPRRAAVSQHWGFGCAALRPLPSDRRRPSRQADPFPVDRTSSDRDRPQRWPALCRSVPLSPSSSRLPPLASRLPLQVDDPAAIRGHKPG